MRVKLDKNGIAKIKQLCERRVIAVRQEFALEAMKYLTHFGYHATQDCGPGKLSGYSFYYAANWNASISVINESVITPERDPFDEKYAAFQSQLESKQNGLMESVIRQRQDIETRIFVTNSVSYGRWLNDGGVSFLTHVTESQPNRFLELCHDHLTAVTNSIVLKVKREIV